MKNAIRSELLRSVSGLSIVPVYLIALLMPAFVLFSDGGRFDLAGLDSGAATARLLQPLAWSAIAAAFVGAYGVTRECYYTSLERTLTAVGRRRSFVAKLVAGALAAVAVSAVIVALWTAGVAFFLTRTGLAPHLTSDAWRIYAGALGGAILGALIGGAVGWITRNYYATAAIVLVLPMVVEFALLRTAPDVAKYSPGLVLAALSVPRYQDRLLDSLPALGIGVAWTVGLLVIAWMRGRRRRA